MYIPKAFEVTEKEKLYNFIKNNSFGILFSQDDIGPMATHLPFLLHESGQLSTHMAKANPHWKSLNGKEVLVVFQGPHAYISPTWYHEENTVPTSNYVAAHVYGTVKIVKSKEETVHLMDQMVNLYESGLSEPWTAPFGTKFIDGLMNGIVMLKITINKVEGKWKLNQIHSIERQQNVVNGLRMAKKYHFVEIADLMEENIQLCTKS